MAQRGLKVMVFVIFALLSINSAQAELIKNGNNLIYDSALDITWYNPSFTNMTWSQAMSWAEDLEIGSATEWRLPSAFNKDGSPPSSGYNQTGSELGHLYYVELGNNSDSANLNPLNLGPFSNLQSVNYWTGTEWTSYTQNAWAFSFATGLLGFADKNPNSTFFQYYSPIAVHSGNISVIQTPEPTTILLLGFGLIGFFGFRRKFKK